MIGIVGIHPDIVEIAVCAVPDSAETLAAILAHDQGEVRLVKLCSRFSDLRSSWRSRRAARPSNYCGPALPMFSRHLRSGKGALRVDSIRAYTTFGFDGRDCDGNAPPRFRGEPFGALFIQFLPGRSAVGGLGKSAAAGCGGILPARTESPALPAKVPHAREKNLGVLRIHGNHRAASREIRTLENLAPALAAICSLVDAAVLAVAPQFSGHARVNRVAVPRIDNNFRNALGILQAHVGPAVAAVRRLIDAIADRHAIAGPGFARAGPDRFRVLVDRWPRRQWIARPPCRKTGLKVVPPFEDFHTPPLAAPT